MTTNTAWPEGVIGRYLTVGGATVDITQRFIGDVAICHAIATCHGCGTEERCDRESGDCRGGPWLALEINTIEARRWAQSHAETCRALPNPNGARR